MGNKKKNKVQLVDQSEDDPTEGYSASGVFRNTATNLDSTLERYAHTIDIDNTIDIGNDGGATARRSRAELESALKEQGRIVEDLKFEIEQICSRQRGLEGELEARLEIADNMNAELGATRSRLEDAKSALETRAAESLAANDERFKTDKLITQLTDQSTGLKTASVEFKRKIKSLEVELKASKKSVAALENDLRKKEKRSKTPERNNEANTLQTSAKMQLKTARLELQDLRNYVNGRKNEWAEMRVTLTSAKAELDSQRIDVEKFRNEIDERHAQLVRSREQYIISSEHLAKQKSKVRDLNKKNRELTSRLNQVAEVELGNSRARIAALEGKLAAQTHEVDGLRKENNRFQQYSDTLRFQLQDQVSIAKISVATKHKLQLGLDTANEMIDQLCKKLDTEQQCNADQAKLIDRQREDFDREVRQIRFELGAAEETLSGQQTLNEKLASDLVDTQGFRRELETLLNEAGRENENSITELSARLTQAKQDASEYERQIENKNQTIADLMNELSKNTSNIELSGEVDNVLKKIDGFRKDSLKPSRTNVRERIARLLVGKADGRELRFPLFKDRLTIGRTSHNDIQLNMQYVSRRHAVISTDQGQTRIIDWGSKNGVFINDKRVTERVLKSGDTVSIGTAEFRYEERIKRQSTD